MKIMAKLNCQASWCKILITSGIAILTCVIMLPSCCHLTCPGKYYLFIEYGYFIVSGYFIETPVSGLFKRIFCAHVI